MSKKKLWKNPFKPQSSRVWGSDSYTRQWQMMKLTTAAKKRENEGKFRIPWSSFQLSSEVLTKFNDSFVAKNRFFPFSSSSSSTVHCHDFVLPIHEITFALLLPLCTTAMAKVNSVGRAASKVEEKKWKKKFKRSAFLGILHHLRAQRRAKSRCFTWILVAFSVIVIEEWHGTVKRCMLHTNREL